MPRKKKENHGKATATAGIALGLVLIGIVCFSMDDNWPWLAFTGAALAAVWAVVLFRRRRLATSLRRIDKMSGHEFEHFLNQLFRKLGYESRNVGQKGADFGADLIISRGDTSWAVQAKNYDSSNVGNDAVQQAIAGATFYDCNCAMVVTNSRFTKSAKKQAERCRIIPVTLWDRGDLESALNRNR